MVLGIGYGYTLRIRKRSSYLHKDSYMAQRRERTLGYEGRYRRTLSPSGMGSKAGGEAPVTSPQQQQQQQQQSPPGKHDSTLSPSAWEKYHNIRPPSTTLIFTSTEIAKAGLGPEGGCGSSTSPQPPLFHRSISCDSNLFNNKTGFSQLQSSGPLPVAQVAPLRGGPPDYHHHGSSSSLYKSQEFLPPYQSSPLRESHKEELGLKTPPLSTQSRREEERTSRTVSDAECQSSDSLRIKRTEVMTSQQSVTVMVSPLRFIEAEVGPKPGTSPPLSENKENIPNGSVLNSSTLSKTSDLSFRLNCTSDASSQTDSGNEEERDLLRVEGDSALPTEPNSLTLTLSSSSSSSSRSSSASSCTEPTLLMMSKGSGPSSLTPTPYTGRQKSQEELDCEELSRDLVKQLPQGDKLQTLLVPLPDHKTSADYMEGLFHLELKLKKEQMELGSGTTSGASSSSHSHSSSPELGESPGLDLESQSPSVSRLGPQDTIHTRCNGHAPLPADSAYFTTSESKAKFLTQYVKDMHNESISHTDSQELNKQKEVLVSRISRKLEILRIEQSEIREEIDSNEQLGQIVIERVKETAKRNEFDKFKLHVEEIEKITSLLLGLSGRLARTENALMGLAENPNPQEKKILESKRDKLKEQLEEAKVLKENIDRRSAQVSGFLQKYLSAEEFADYHHFTKMKAKLIIDAREIDDKIKLGDEQLLALQETLTSAS